MVEEFHIDLKENEDSGSSVALYVLVPCNKRKNPSVVISTWVVGRYHSDFLKCTKFLYAFNDKGNSLTATNT